MPGTPVQDKDATNLLAGTTLTVAASTQTGTAAEVGRPGAVRAHLETATVSSTGNVAVFEAEIQSCDAAAFSSDVSTHGSFKVGGTDANQSNGDFFMDVDIKKRYVRVVAIVTGTAGSYAATTLKLRARDTHRQLSNTAG